MIHINVKLNVSYVRISKDLNNITKSDNLRFRIVIYIIWI